MRSEVTKCGRVEWRGGSRQNFRTTLRCFALIIVVFHVINCVILRYSKSQNWSTSNFMQNKICRRKRCMMCRRHEKIGVFNVNKNTSKAKHIKVLPCAAGGC